MQIHELNEFSGNPGNGDWYIVDSGTDTAKVNGGLLAYKTDVDVLEAQVTDVITNNNGYKIEALWTGSAYTGDTTLSLSKAITNYDYLDFYAFISGIVQIYTVDATTGNLFVKGLNLTDDDSGKSVSLYEMKCVIDTQAVEIEFNHEWKWSGSSSASASKVSNPTACRLEKIVGRKCVVNQSDTEVLDIRVGADGTTYDSAGNAVRAQISTLSGEVGNLGNLETTEKSNLVAAINEVKQTGGGGGTGLTEDIKAALLQIASKVAYIDDDGQDYYDALYDALYPPANLVSISAVYTQSGDVYETDTLDSLKSDLVVTGTYDDSTTRPITGYTLSGTLELGTSTITVSYGGKTTTFTVVVTEYREPPIYEWDFTRSLTDEIEGIQFTLGDSSGGSSLPTRDSTGLHFTGACQIAQAPLTCGTASGWLYEFDIASAEFAGDASKHKRFMSISTWDAIVFRNQSGIQIYRNAWVEYTPEQGQAIPTSPNDLSGKTISVRFGTDKTAYLYLDGVLIAKKENWIAANYDYTNLVIGGHATGSQSDGNQIYNMTITGFRIYEEETA